MEQRESKGWGNPVNARDGWTSEEEAALERAVVSESEQTMFSCQQRGLPGQSWILSVNVIILDSHRPADILR